jgi:hypothetical protein
MSGGAAAQSAATRRVAPPGIGARALRALLVCAGALALGAASVAGLVLAASWAAPGIAPTGTAPPFVRSAALWALGRAVFVQALAPHILAVWVAWLALVVRWPALDGSWGRIALGGAGIGFAVAPALTHVFFSAWTPVTPLDSLRTWVLLGAAAAACLVLARRAIPGLGPGALGAPTSEV